ncbi:MAG TPA: MFS transporter, partial [Actinomycetota bacterium]|nr:MFS transporter [Actinomycetota bacterium]
MAAQGIRANLPQFTLLVVMNGLVGALIGQERSLVPLLADGRFGLESAVATSAFLVTFGLAKAPANLVAGLLADRIGRKRVMQIGWLAGLPVPFILMGAGSWELVVAANVLLGINQGFTWSTTVLMKIDLAADEERGRAVGWNEAAGYTAVGVSALASGLLADRFGLGVEPFVLGAVVAGAGLLLTASVRETARPRADAGSMFLDLRRVTSDRRLTACARTGLVNNANDAFAWALLPLLLLRHGKDAGDVAAVAATYAIVWG